MSLSGTVSGLARLAISTGGRRRPEGFLGIAVRIYAALVAVWVVYQATLSSIDVLALSIIFVSIMLVLVFLMYGASEQSHETQPSWFDWVLVLASVVTGLFFISNISEIATRISLFDELSAQQKIFSALMVLLTLEATRRTVGAGLMLIVILFIIYNLFGDRLEGVLQHGEISIGHFLDINVFTTDGLFGIPIRVAATYAFVFVMFGTFLEKARGGDFFFDLAAIISGRSAGGPAKVAVFSSALFGTVSGSPTSDVVTTGSITIPMMKRLGYPGSLAGGVEVAASTGGSLLPPIMGSAAFIMAEYTGIPYSEIIVAALIPALLYYLGVFLQVHLRSVKIGLAPLPSDRVPSLSTTLINGWIYIVPIVAIVVALVQGYSPTYVACFGTIAVIVASQFRKDARITPRGLFDGLADTTIRMIGVTGACAAAGLVIGGITMTGLATKFSYLVLLFGSSSVLPALMIGAAVTIILGLGMPTPSAYVLAAVLIGPVLVNELNVPVMAAHMFLLYYAVMSAMTPPVAVAAYAAAAIAGDNPLKIAATAVMFSIVAFLIPFGFVHNAGLLMIGNPVEIVAAVLAAILAVVFLAIATEGFMRAQISNPLRVLLAVAALGMLSPLGWWTIAFAVVGGGIVAVLWRAHPVTQGST
ncbi:MAG: TRAP transporter permease [Hyphomicrobiaceae bacterium]